MATYAIGDVQGCYEELMALLDEIGFDEKRDRLWFTGDLVNRGPDSLKVLRFVKGLGDTAVTVLGNHDLHLLARAAGKAKAQDKDTLKKILGADDRDELLAWLRWRPLLHHDPQLGFTLIHAGLPPQWDFSLAQLCAAEVEAILRSDEYVDFLAHMYGNEPDYWDDSHEGWDRLRFITNCFTRLRFCDKQGHLNLKAKGQPGTQNKPYRPWFSIKKRRSQDMRIVFGHWSTLGFYRDHGVIGIDTGCLWGGLLTAVCLDDGGVFCYDCEGQQAIDEA